MWFVYILRCSDNTFYTGITTDIKRRIKEHNNKLGGNYTRGRVPVRLVYKEVRPDRSDASVREAQIKKLPRSHKLKLIKAYKN